MNEIPELSDIIGIPFRQKGRDQNGFDCYGCAMEVSKRFGHDLPEVNYEVSDDKTFDEKYKSVISGLKGTLKRTRSPSPGDLVLFSCKGKMVHIGVCLIGDDFIHCNKYGVHVSKLSSFVGEYEVYKWSS